MNLSTTAEAIKQYKLTFNWKNGYESWSKVPTTDRIFALPLALVTELFRLFLEIIAIL